MESQKNGQPSEKEEEEMFYELKKIKYFERHVAIILQNMNGPCPLIAIGNVLLLRGNISVSADRSRISLEELSTLIAEHLMDSNAVSRVTEELKENYYMNVSDAIAQLPSMQFGLDVNVKFTGPKEFEYTKECVIFDLLGIDLVHGWMLDPAEKEMYDLINPLSYNQCVEKLIAMNVLLSPESTTESTAPQSSEEIKSIVDEREASEGKVSLEIKRGSLGSPISSSTRKLSLQVSPKVATIRKEDIKMEDEERILREGTAVEKYLSESASQFTKVGLEALRQSLQDRQLAVLFRNNHFSTLFKEKKDLYLLVTDAGYLNEPIVWEKLDHVGGDTVFCRSDFGVYQGSMLPPMISSAVNAVGSSLSTIFSGTQQDGEYHPSVTEVDEQLRIEQQILRESREEADYNLAIELHKEELRISKEEVQMQTAIQKQQRADREKQKLDEKVQKQKSKDKEKGQPNPKGQDKKEQGEHKSSKKDCVLQ